VDGRRHTITSANGTRIGVLSDRRTVGKVVLTT